MLDKEVYDILKTWGRVDRVKFAIWAAEKVLPIWEGEFPDNKTPHLAIEAAKNWVDQPTIKNVERARKARGTGVFGGVNISNAMSAAGQAAAEAAWETYLGNDYELRYIYPAYCAAVALGNSPKELLDEYMISSLEKNSVPLAELNRGL